MAESDHQTQITRRVAAAEDRFDALRLKLKARFGSRKALQIYPYIGHATADTLYLRGRVMLDNNIRPPSETDSPWRNLKNMYKRFESDEIPYARVMATLGNTSQEVVCDEEGFFKVVMRPEAGIQSNGFWQEVQLEVKETLIPTLDTASAKTTGRVIVPPKNAQYAVVSDLDDTIMRTDVLNLFKMLRNTMLRNAYTRLPFEGVAAFYRALHQGTNNTQNPIFYVSSSPWNLYDVIIDFYKIRGIPLGPVYLRNIGISKHSLGATGHMEHKVGLIQSLMDRHANLPFILIGDSGQKDPRVYREIVKRNPGRILAIYIRDVARIKLANLVEEIAIEVQSMGTEMILVKDTSDAARHAARHGFITTECLPQIDRECHQDEEQTTLIERMLEE